MRYEIDIPADKLAEFHDELTRMHSTVSDTHGFLGGFEWARQGERIKALVYFTPGDCTRVAYISLDGTIEHHEFRPRRNHAEWLERWGAKQTEDES